MQQIDQRQPSENALAFRGLKPIGTLAAGRDHGDRLRYLAGCRCPSCRASNSQYERNRQDARKNGQSNGIVSANQARDHLLSLAAEGIGRRSVAAVTDIASSTIAAIRSGEKRNIREKTERLILAVTPLMAADHGLIDATASNKLIEELLSAGFTKKRIAKELGSNTPALQIARRDKVIVRTAHLIRNIHTRLMKTVVMPTTTEIPFVASTATMQRIASLRSEWFTSKQIARHLNITPEELASIGRTVSVDFERHVQEVHQRLMQ